ncbi:MAG: hypothetical protein AAF333_07475 [Planctomycetota bacterium]
MTQLEFFNVLGSWGVVFGQGIGVGLSLCFVVHIGMTSSRVVTELFRK